MKLDKGKILRKIDGDQAFFVNDGSVIRSLEELPTALQNMADETFEFHRDRNDFSNWIRDICGDTRLANDLMKVKTKGTSVKKVAARVDILLK